jgi:hypothetical protein
VAILFVVVACPCLLSAAVMNVCWTDKSKQQTHLTTEYKQGEAIIIKIPPH